MNVYAARILLIFSVIFTCLLVGTTIAGPLDSLRNIEWGRSDKPPDFSVYNSLLTLPPERFPSDARDHRRTIILGDIHGRNDSFHKLLSTLSYDPALDSLIHVGDIIAKGPISGSLAILSFMAKHNITGVRGNHDQKVIEWYGWLQWIHGRAPARAWITDLERRWTATGNEEGSLKKWLKHQRRQRPRRDSRWWKSMPNDQAVFGPHYQIARRMTAEHYAYMVSRPLVLHIPSAHAFIVHAGLLSSDPHYHPHHERQPLARVPKLESSEAPNQTESRVDQMRRLQELALISDVPQNQDPWATLNMRSIRPYHSVSRKNSGKPWSEHWNRDMSMCAGFELEKSTIKGKKGEKMQLLCYASTVIYGHAAARGLDIKRWSIGLDSGCTYNRKLSALVLGSARRHALEASQFVVQDIDDAEHAFATKPPKPHIIPFGDDNEGHIVSVPCHYDSI